MNFSERLYQLRKERGISQEELSNVVNVSRQAVQKWEAGASTPDVENLSALANYFQVTLDYLIRGVEPTAQQVQNVPYPPHCNPMFNCHCYEYKSTRTLWGLPLVHIKIGHGFGFSHAKGIVAIGNIATGVVALGGCSAGLLSLGGLSVGLLALGGIAAGGVALGGIAVGLVALGGCAIGCIAFGGSAVGAYAVGGGAVGTQIAIGDAAHSAGVAVGNQLSGDGLKITSDMAAGLSIESLCDMARPHLPSTPKWLLRMMMTLAQNM